MEMAERISQLLSDENAMSQIQQLAQGLDMSSIGGLMGMLSGGGESAGGCGGGQPQCSQEDPNVELLRALRPFLSTKRRKRANEAVKIMKMLALLPMLQESGLLNNLMGGGEDE